MHCWKMSFTKSVGFMKKVYASIQRTGTVTHPEEFSYRYTGVSAQILSPKKWNIISWNIISMKYHWNIISYNIDNSKILFLFFIQS